MFWIFDWIFLKNVSMRISFCNQTTEVYDVCYKKELFTTSFDMPTNGRLFCGVRLKPFPHTTLFVGKLNLMHADWHPSKHVYCFRCTQPFSHISASLRLHDCYQNLDINNWSRSSYVGVTLTMTTFFKQKEEEIIDWLCWLKSSSKFVGRYLQELV